MPRILNTQEGRGRGGVLPGDIPVVLRTELGDMVFSIHHRAAPISAGNFLAYADGGLLDGSSIYRIVTLANQPDDVPAKIEVFQWGWKFGVDALPLPPIEHEPTGRPGLKHRHGTLSMARRQVGTAGHAFFVTLGDQPELDEGGKRNPDGHGFAAFGDLMEGEEVLRVIFTRAEPEELLRSPIRIESVRRL